MNTMDWHRARVSGAAASEHSEPVSMPNNIDTDNYTESGGGGLPPDHFLPLIWGFDTLVISCKGNMLAEAKERLATLKRYAQHSDDEHLAQVAVAGHIFEVMDKGRLGYAYILRCPAFEIQLCEADSPKIPVAYVKVLSRFMLGRSPEEVLHELLRILEHFCMIDSHCVSRADLYLDFCCNDADIQEARAEQFVTRASLIRPYYTDLVLTGWDIGLGSDLAARIYNKTLEITKSGKEYMRCLWKDGGWNGEEKVWRLEFQLRRSVLDGMSITTVPELAIARPGLWTYLTKEWLRHCIPQPTDGNRTRWPSSPLWLNIWDGAGGALESPMRRHERRDSAPELEAILHRLCGVLASLFAVLNITQLPAAISWLGLNLPEALRRNYSPKGIRLDYYLKQQVKRKIRAYHLGLNDEEFDNPSNFYK